MNYVFEKWKIVKAGDNDDNLQDVNPAADIDIESNKYTDKVTVIEVFYKKQIAAVPLEPVPTGIMKKLNLYIPVIIISILTISTTLIFILKRKRRNAR